MGRSKWKGTRWGQKPLFPQNPDRNRPCIKFSQAYLKLLVNDERIRCAYLLQVLLVDRDELSQEFINYDTDYGKYILKPGKYLLLIFRKEYSGHIFTTVRPAWSQYHKDDTSKLEYYQGLVGQLFTVEITDEKFSGKK